MSDSSGVPFSFFVSLLREISQIPPQKTTTVRSRTNVSYPAVEIFRRWIVQLRSQFSPLPLGSTSIIFRLLFPEEDTCRKYDMQETRLSQHLAECLGLNAQKLEQWSSEGSSGSLGHELKKLLEIICPNTEYASPLSISQVDELLDELASNSGFSDVTIRRKYPRGVRRGRLPLLKILFRPLSPTDASFLAHIILKDLRPVLYPLQETHCTTALISYNTASVRMLTKEHAMQAWDPTCSMLKAYLVRATIDAAATYFELPLHQREPNIPHIGFPVEIPASVKGRDCPHALSFFRHSRRVWAETKYDGERAQIHVEILPNVKPRITIFSKSKRNSTMDRRAIHDIILEALNLSNLEGHEPKLKKNVILDAEMVACDGTNIDEFWRIRNLIERTAYGIRHNHSKHNLESSSNSCTPSSVEADSHHLALVFFDVLLFDSVSLLWTPYAHRREILESIVRPISGRSTLSDRVPIDLHSQDVTCALRTLEKIFKDIVDRRQEGIVLKADEASYHDFRTQWVKLKKDYIPGYGDALDLVVVGAGWDKTRAQELRVAPTTLTTLYIGALTNPYPMTGNTGYRPNFHVYFTVSYGLSRQQLEEVNFLLKNSDPVPFNCASMSTEFLPFDFTLVVGLPPPRIILTTPLLAELFGAGFTKSPPSQNYELRFPRVTKVYRAKERSWKDGIDLPALQRIARDVAVLDRSDDEVRDWCNDLWGKPTSPVIKASVPLKRTARSAPNAIDQNWITTGNLSPSERKRAHSSDIEPLIISQPLALATRTNVDNKPPRSTIHSPQFQNKQLSFRIEDSTISAIVPGVTNLPYNSKLDNVQPEPGTMTAESSGITSQPTLGVILSPAFLEHALVWFAKPSGCTPGSSDHSWKNFVPWQQRLHSVESFLTGCGWHTDDPGSAWVERGVVFVDESNETGKKWKLYALKAVEERRATLTASKSLLPRKPIWIFDVNTWTLERCDIQSHGLPRLDSRVVE